VYPARDLVNKRLRSSTFKVLWKIVDNNFVPGLPPKNNAKDGDRLNENLSWETIFLATTLINE